MKYQKAETSWELYCLEHSARWWVAIRPKCWEVCLFSLFPSKKTKRQNNTNIQQ